MMNSVKLEDIIYEQCELSFLSGYLYESEDGSSDKKDNVVVRIFKHISEMCKKVYNWIVNKLKNVFKKIKDLITRKKATDNKSATKSDDKGKSDDGKPVALLNEPMRKLSSNIDTNRKIEVKGWKMLNLNKAASLFQSASNLLIASCNDIQENRPLSDKVETSAKEFSDFVHQEQVKTINIGLSDISKMVAEGEKYSKIYTDMLKKIEKRSNILEKHFSHNDALNKENVTKLSGLLNSLIRSTTFFVNRITSSMNTLGTITNKINNTSETSIDLKA